MAVGMVVLGGGTLLFRAGMVSGLIWMILTGLGSYLAYVPFNTILFERLMAYTRFAGTAVFAIYLADAAGYTGSIILQVGKDIFAGEMQRQFFFELLCGWQRSALWFVSLRLEPLIRPQWQEEQV